MRKIKYMSRILIMHAIKLKGGKIVFAVHDKVNHDKRSRSTENEKIMLFMLKYSDKILVYGQESISFIKSLVPDIDLGKIVYIPHPDFNCAYRGTKPYTTYVKKENEIVLLFMGSISPYKNIEILIQAANQLQGITDIHFLICGRGNEEYHNQLRSMIEGNNVTADFRFIEEEEIPSLLKLSDVLLIPYNTVSALNSGSAFLAFSFGRTVIGTWTGTTRDLNDPNLVYCYDDTDDEAEHVSRLRNAIMKFYEDFKRDEASVKAKGEKLREIMITEHSLEKVAEGLLKAYS